MNDNEEVFFNRSRENAEKDKQGTIAIAKKIEEFIDFDFFQVGEFDKIFSRLSIEAARYGFEFKRNNLSNKYISHLQNIRRLVGMLGKRLGETNVNHKDIFDMSRAYKNIDDINDLLTQVYYPIASVQEALRTYNNDNGLYFSSQISQTLYDALNQAQQERVQKQICAEEEKKFSIFDKIKKKDKLRNAKLTNLKLQLALLETAADTPYNGRLSDLMVKATAFLLSERNEQSTDDEQLATSVNTDTLSNIMQKLILDYNMDQERLNRLATEQGIETSDFSDLSTDEQVDIYEIKSKRLRQLIGAEKERQRTEKKPEIPDRSAELDQSLQNVEITLANYIQYGITGETRKNPEEQTTVIGD